MSVTSFLVCILNSTKTNAEGGEINKIGGIYNQAFNTPAQPVRLTFNFLLSHDGADMIQNDGSHVGSLSSDQDKLVGVI